jgi:micrococcal nuclease
LFAVSLTIEVDAAGPLNEAQIKTATVVRVIDGDTVTVRLTDNSQYNIRLIGIDAPEDTTVVEPFGPEATAYLRNMLPVGRQVWLVREGNNMSFNRLRRHIFLQNPTTNSSEAFVRQNSIGARMLTAGFGIALPNFTPIYRDLFIRLENEARNARRGMWSVIRHIS